jgi:Outer membrane protein beta-barrel domain
MMVCKPAAINILLVLSFMTSSAYGAVRFTIGGNHEKSNAGYQQVESGGGSAGVSLDLGEYFRIGVTHREEQGSTTGYHQLSGTENYTYFKTKSNVSSNGVDLTLCLYNGEIVTPYIFGGITNKHYIMSTTEADGSTTLLDKSKPGPQGGVGLGIRLNEKFSLKLSETWSIGDYQVPGNQAQSAVDTYSQVGVSYAL